MLFRHSNQKVRALIRAGADVEEYTSVQPTNTKYDYLDDGKPPIQILVVIVEDRVRAVFRVNGVLRRGTTQNLVSP
jgi:hypothetical protein